MFRYSTTYINILSFVISIIIFFITNLFILNQNIFSKNIFKADFNINNLSVQENPEEKKNEEKLEEISKSTNDEWYLEIPKINLKAKIKEGTTKEIMDDYIGHFEESKKEEGNVCLAAHNRGYKNNYFENIKTLKEGDKIHYKYNNFDRVYVVVSQTIIKDTDWTNLEDTDDNTITLITCVENQKEYRRCIQGKELKEESEENII